MIIVLRHVLAQLTPVVVPLAPSQGMGERFHNTHHAFPTSARHGLRWWPIDVSYDVIRALALVRLAWNVKLPTKQAQAEERRVWRRLPRDGCRGVTLAGPGLRRR